MTTRVLDLGAVLFLFALLGVLAALALLDKAAPDYFISAFTLAVGWLLRAGAGAASKA